MTNDPLGNDRHNEFPVQTTISPIVLYHFRQLSLITLGGDATLTILHPGPSLVTGGEADSNNNSIVIRLAWGQVSILLPGDIEAEVERELVQSGQSLTSAVLKAPHYGSGTSSTPAFLEAVNPQLLVISVGQDNRFGHPSPDVLTRLVTHTVLRTPVPKLSYVWTLSLPKSAPATLAKASSLAQTLHLFHNQATKKPCELADSRA